MKKVGKPIFFIVVAVILVIGYLSFAGLKTSYGDITTTWIKGADDIRWGIDIRGGVDVTFRPDGDIDATDEQMRAAESIIKTRLIDQGITDYEVYTDLSRDRIIVRFPWKVGETDFNPEEAIQELGATALLTFREGLITDSNGTILNQQPETVILEGKDIVQAQAGLRRDDNTPIVMLTFSEEGQAKFNEASSRLAGQVISIWMDDTLISYPRVSENLTGSGGQTYIEGDFTAEEATELADRINAGALPFKLVTDNFSTISPTLGSGAKDAMVLAGIIAFVLIAIFIIALYRLPGVVATIALAGQVSLTIAAITGFFGQFPSFTLTLPGMAGVILAIGMGVDANIITAERIKEELNAGKTIDGAIASGFKRAFTAILDGNITVIIVAIILMGTFGPPDSFWAKVLSPLYAWIGSAMAGNIYSFGYTLLVGVIFNFFGIFVSRLMLQSLSKFSACRKNWLYGGAKHD